MASDSLRDALAAVSELSPPGTVRSVVPMGTGRINDTYLVRYEIGGVDRGLVLQRINPAVFPHPEWIIENMQALQRHIEKRKGGDVEFTFPNLAVWRGGACHWKDGNGGVWRATDWIGDCETRPRAQGPDDAAEVGAVLGRFHALTGDMDASQLRDTLPGYHNCPAYLGMLDNTIGRGASGDCGDRFQAEGVASMIGFVDARRRIVGILEGERESGRLRERVTHGDPKVDNVLLHRGSGKGVGLVDFDTLKPGLLPCDFGDAARSVCNTSGEDAAPERVRFDMDCFHAFATRYLAEAAGVLSSGETHVLFDSVRVVTLELGIRFLQDYLAGNRYFRMSDPESGRRCAMAQFALCAEIERKEPDGRAVISDALRHAARRPSQAPTA
jgi:hypothetical protein